MPKSILNDVALEKLAGLAHQAASLQVSAEVHARGRRRIMASAASLRSASPGIRATRKWAVGVLAAAAAFAVAWWSSTRMRPISYQITGGSGFESGYVSAPPDHSMEILFSDGSAIDARADTRLRVESTRRDGARILIERGMVEAQIHHAKGSSWRFVAGPFEVRVVGTQFTLVWEPSKEEVYLAMHEGVVEVQSPLGQGPFVVRKGQRFHASLLTHSVQLQDTSAAANAATALQGAREPQPAATDTSKTAGPVASSEESRTAPISNSSLAPKSSSARPESWSLSVSHGRFQAVVDAAQAQGTDNCCSTCSLDDLRALADAARYTGRSDLAEQSLQAIRKRAAAGSQRAAATFLLGRLSESRGQMTAANAWYDTYLSESPSGEFAADSLAGKMRAVAKMNGTAAARPLAMQYLQRYPNGAQADKARQIAGSD
jgi:TolA-binding protein